MYIFHETTYNCIIEVGFCDIRNNQGRGKCKCNQMVEQKINSEV